MMDPQVLHVKNAMSGNILLVLDSHRKRRERTTSTSSAGIASEGRKTQRSPRFQH